ncbi:MAG: exodeoxyribonuclease VII small subunit [Dysgonamonadaceae bacterium]
MAKKEKTYNDAIAELKSILERIEKEDMDVDLLSSEVKKASELIAFCRGKLFKADEELKNILNNLEV